MVFKTSDLPMDRTEHLEASFENVDGDMDICDDGVEELDAVLHVTFLRRILTNVHGSLEDLFEIIVGENSGVELADVGGILEDAT